MLTKWEQPLPRKTSIFITGTSVAFALLCHGGAFFSLLSIALIALIRWFRKALWIGVPASIISAIIYVPWVAYQKLIDPPGNRLIKWHLADMSQPNELSSFQAIHAAYEKLTWAEWLHDRMLNLHIILFEGWNKLFDLNKILDGNFSALDYLNGFQSISFFYFFTSLWFYSPFIGLFIGLINILKKRLPNADTIWLILTLILGIFIWILLMFQPASTLIHQGSYFFWIGTFIVSAQLFVQAHRHILIAFSILNSLVGIRYLLFDNYQWPLPNELYPYYLLTLIMTLFFISSSFKATTILNKQFKLY